MISRFLLVVKFYESSARAITPVSSEGRRSPQELAAGYTILSSARIPVKVVDRVL